MRNQRENEREVPPPRYVPAEHILAEMAAFGHRRLNLLSAGRALVLAVLGGGFITVGALFSVLLAEGADVAGTERLLEGIGFSAGFFFVVLSETVLFTEANVVIPATLLETHEARWRVVRFWTIAWLGNFIGALAVGWLIALAHDYPTPLLSLLEEIVDRKMAVAGGGGAAGWGRMVVSGILANWLVGTAVLFAMMGRTIFGKYVPVGLAVTLFVAANFQPSPANMGYFSLLMTEAMDQAGPPPSPGTSSRPGWATWPEGLSW